MINYIQGIVTEKGDGYIVVETGGIGYEMCASSVLINSIEFLNDECKVLTYMQVKEDGISLFGFFNKEEKQMFLKLISVNGVGPKMAMAIISSMSLSSLYEAIISQDVKMLTTIKGMGKKTAERLVLELKDKTSIDVSKNSIMQVVNNDYVSQVSDALESLGVSKNEAYRLAKLNYSEDKTIEEIITNALRGMGN